MTNRIDRVNRFLLTLLGVVCAGGGVVVLLLGFEVFGADWARRPLLQPETRDFADRNAGWFWLVVGVGIGVLALLALWWLLAQASTARVGTLQVDPPRPDGGTRLSAGAVTDAVSEEIEGYRGVSGVNARLLGARTSPTLRLDVALEESADLGQVRSRIEQGALPRVRQATDPVQMPAQVRLRVAAAERRRVL